MGYKGATAAGKDPVAGQRLFHLNQGGAHPPCRAGAKRSTSQGRCRGLGTRVVLANANSSQWHQGKEVQDKLSSVLGSRADISCVFQTVVAVETSWTRQRASVTKLGQDAVDDKSLVMLHKRHTISRHA